MKISARANRKRLAHSATHNKGTGMRSLLSAGVLWAAMLCPTFAQTTAVSPVRLYALDCGRLQFTDLAPFADTGEYDGRPGTFMASCFLIRHARGDLLWEAGLGDQYAGQREGVKLPLYRAFVPISLESQLRSLGLNFADIEFFAFSHGHGDHLGNAARLTGATWLINSRELAWLETSPPPPRTNPQYVGHRDTSTSVMINSDHDVFGDGSVRILSTPGHTPGHQVLMLSLANSGTVILSGDLFHSRENRAGRRRPVFNTDRAATLASMDRVESILRNRRGRLIIQHSTEDFMSLPKLPAFLD